MTPIRIPNYAFVDGQNLYHGLEELGYELKYQEFIEYLKGKYKCQKVFVFFKENQKFDGFYAELTKMGYIVILSKSHNRVNGVTKSNVDGDLIVKAMSDYFESQKHNLILLSGDGDFLPLINFYEKKDHFVQIISTDYDHTSVFLKRKGESQNYQKRNISYFFTSNVEYRKNTLYQFLQVISKT